jgi:beta-lactamase superfamily II metal-dependent hydrolase
MGYEIDFMPVGEGERSGDAIALRYGNLAGPRDQQTVIVIDGGTKASGESLVAHIQRYYGTNKVDFVISTHPDADHSSGLTVVLENMQVGNLFMHQPWNHAEQIRACMTDPLTKSKVEERVWRALENARELEKLANAKKIPIQEPFSDTFKFVLSPSKAFYQQQVANFRCMPEAEKPLIDQFVESLWGAVVEAAKILESWWGESLADPEEDATSAENNSSVVLILVFDGHGFLFTSDAGVPALTEAANRAEALAIDLKQAKYVQVPHHGSRRNVGPTILNRIIGPIKEQEVRDKTAFISAAKDSNSKHPAKKVVNAFKRRGASVYATQGKGLWQHSSDAPPRQGWSSAAELPFYEEVED